MRVPAAVIFGVLAVALTPVAAVSGSFEDGVDAYASGNYAAALGLWRPLAERGEADSQHNLGVVYRDGQGVARDHAEAAKWFKLAADQGEELGLVEDFEFELLRFLELGSRLRCGDDVRDLLGD